MNCCQKVSVSMHHTDKWRSTWRMCNGKRHSDNLTNDGYLSYSVADHPTGQASEQPGNSRKAGGAWHGWVKIKWQLKPHEKKIRADEKQRVIKFIHSHVANQEGGKRRKWEKNIFFLRFLCLVRSISILSTIMKILWIILILLYSLFFWWDILFLPVSPSRLVCWSSARAQGWKKMKNKAFWTMKRIRQSVCVIVWQEM